MALNAGRPDHATTWAPAVRLRPGQQGARHAGEPASDIDPAVIKALKALDPNRPIREADINYRHGARSRETIEELM